MSTVTRVVDLSDDPEAALTALANQETFLSVGPVPSRRGVWLGVATGSEWHALAKFRSAEAADVFMRLLKGDGK